MFGESWPAILCADWSPEPLPNKWTVRSRLPLLHSSTLCRPERAVSASRTSFRLDRHIDPNATVLSIDGHSFDLVSREAMLRGLLSVEGGDTVLPFVRQFYGTPSTYLWQDDDGTVHDVQQGEGGEQGDALMPALFALGQHNALVTLQLRLRFS